MATGTNLTRWWKEELNSRALCGEKTGSSATFQIYYSSALHSRNQTCGYETGHLWLCIVVISHKQDFWNTWHKWASTVACKAVVSLCSS